MNGLLRLRRFRRFTVWMRYPTSLLVIALNNFASILGMRKSSERKSLVQTKESRYQPQIAETIIRLATNIHSMPLRDKETKAGDERREKGLSEQPASAEPV